MKSLRKILTNGLLVLALFFGITMSATAISVSDFEEVEAAAEQGSSLAQSLLGTYYSTGQGVPQDYSKALEWFKKSANQGDSFGQFNMGYAYLNGRSVRQDHSKALEWFKKAANQNNPTAQSTIGLMYEYGDGVRQNKTTAKEWYGKSCDNGYQGGCDNYKKLNEQGY